MSLESYIANLREKPEHIRKKYALYGSLGFTSVIFIFWMSSVTVTGIGGGQNVQVAEAVQKAGTPSQSMMASVGNLFGDIKDLILKPRVVTYEPIEVLPGK